MFFGIAGLIVLVVIVIFAVSYSKYGRSLEKEASHINITNFSEVAKDIPEFYQVETEASIWNMLNSYNDIADDVRADAIIREGSFSDEKRWVSFLVDIPSLEHSFRVEFSWVETSKIPEEFDVSVTCPNLDERIYKTSCYTSFSAVDTIDTFLPETITSGNLEIMLSWEGDISGSYMNADFIDCSNNVDEASVKRAVEGWIDKFGFGSENIEVRYNSWCPRSNPTTEVEYDEPGDHTLPEETLRAMN